MKHNILTKIFCTLLIISLGILGGLSNINSPSTAKAFDPSDAYNPTNLTAIDSNATGPFIGSDLGQNTSQPINPTCTNGSLKSTDYDITYGREYLVSFWVQNTAEVTLKVQGQTPYYYIMASRTFKSDSSWQKFSYKFYGTANEKVWFNLSSNSQVCFGNFQFINTGMLNKNGLNSTISNEFFGHHNSGYYNGSNGWPSDSGFKMGFLRSFYCDARNDDGTYQGLSQYQRTQQRGQELVCTFNYPSTVSNPNESTVLTDQEIRDKARTMANAYKGKVKYWEGPNEYDQYYPPTQNPRGNAREAVRYARIMSEEFKAIDPAIKILSGNTIYFTGIEAWDEFLKNGGGEYVDVFAHHGDNIHTHNLKSLFDSYGYGNKEVWMTESGIGPNCDCRSFALEKLLVSYTGGDKRFAWYSSDTSDFKIMTAPNQPTIAGEALKKSGQWLLGTKILNLEIKPNGTHISKAVLPNGKIGYFVWQKAFTETQILDIPVSWRVIQREDIMSAISPFSSGNLTLTKGNAYLLTTDIVENPNSYSSYSSSSSSQNSSQISSLVSSQKSSSLSSDISSTVSSQSYVSSITNSTLVSNNISSQNISSVANSSVIFSQNPSQNSSVSLSQNSNFVSSSKVLTSTSPIITSPKLLDYAKANGIKLGVAVKNEYLGEADYVNTATAEFDSFTSEYAMKPNQWWLGVNDYNFVEGDKLADLAKSKGIKMRGHTLVWYLRPPDWLPSSNFTTQEYRDILRKGLYDYVKHYEDKYPGIFYAWDVVNEQIQDVNGEMRTNNFWYNKLGDDMFSIAFQAARDAAPNAKLVINDYYIEVPSPKVDSLIALINRLKQAGVSVDGVGFQSHFKIGNEPNYPLFVDIINRFKAVGVEVEFTEIDMRGGSQNEKGTRTYDVIKACLITKCKGITFWGITDKYSWLEGENGLLFDDNYNRKPMYNQAVQAFKDFGVSNVLASSSNSSTNISSPNISSVTNSSQNLISSQVLSQTSNTISSQKSSITSSQNISSNQSSAISSSTTHSSVSVIVSSSVQNYSVANQNSQNTISSVVLGSNQTESSRANQSSAVLSPNSSSNNNSSQVSSLTANSSVVSSVGSSINSSQVVSNQVSSLVASQNTSSTSTCQIVVPLNDPCPNNPSSTVSSKVSSVASSMTPSSQNISSTISSLIQNSQSSSSSSSSSSLSSKTRTKQFDNLFSKGKITVELDNTDCDGFDSINEFAQALGYVEFKATCGRTRIKTYWEDLDINSIYRFVKFNVLTNQKDYSIPATLSKEMRNGRLSWVSVHTIDQSHQPNQGNYSLQQGKIHDPYTLELVLVDANTNTTITGAKTLILPATVQNQLAQPTQPNINIVNDNGNINNNPSNNSNINATNNANQIVDQNNLVTNSTVENRIINGTFNGQRSTVRTGGLSNQESVAGVLISLLAIGGLFIVTKKRKTV